MGTVTVPWPESEVAIGELVVPYLQDGGWTVYQEVSHQGRIADIVATLGPLVAVVELKRSLSFALLEQAVCWKTYAHMIWAAVPQPRRAHMAQRVFSDYGIGVLSVTEQYPHVTECRQPKLNRKVFAAELRSSLVGHQPWNKAGSATCERWTPFKHTRLEVQRVVAANPGITMKDLFEKAHHHYRTDSTARACTLQHIKAGIIPGIELRKEGKLLRLYPK